MHISIKLSTLAMTLSLLVSCNAAKFGGKKASAAAPNLTPPACAEGKTCPETTTTADAEKKDNSTQSTDPASPVPPATDPTKAPEPLTCQQELEKCTTDECRAKFKDCKDQPAQTDGPGQVDKPSQNDTPSQHQAPSKI